MNAPETRDATDRGLNPTPGLSGPRGAARRSQVAQSFMQRMARRFGRRGPLIAHSIIPVEVPVLTETKRLWASGKRTESVRFAYLNSLQDLQRAFGVRFPPNWTHEEIQVHGMTPAMGGLPEFFLHLYHLYEPVRYGGSKTPEGNPADLLQSIYGYPEMWQLYAQGMIARPAREALPPLPRSAVRPPSGAT